jgi:hypothetical protein
MTKQNSKKIEKPWAVYGWYLGSWGIGKVVEEKHSNCCEIQYCEGQMYPPELWDSKWVNRFQNPLESINYFLEHNSNKDHYYKKEIIIQEFLSHFPSEKKNLKKLLAQSKP